MKGFPQPSSSVDDLPTAGTEARSQWHYIEYPCQVFKCRCPSTTAKACSFMYSILQTLALILRSIIKLATPCSSMQPGPAPILCLTGSFPGPQQKFIYLTSGNCPQNTSLCNIHFFFFLQTPLNELEVKHHFIHTAKKKKPSHLRCVLSKKQLSLLWTIYEMCVLRSRVSKLVRCLCYS